MKGLAFEVKGTVAHFRRPDTTATQVTYPFITPTAVKGLVGAILGITDFVTEDKIGIELLSPVKTVAQQMSMLGKDGGASFNRPTTIELVVNPAYRIYYTGEEYTDQLINYLKKEKFVYATYLGVAYALTKPILYEEYNEIFFEENLKGVIETRTVVPTAIIKELMLKETRYFCRAGGFMHEYKGDRTFEKSIDFIYERDGQTISFVPREDKLLDVKIGKFGEDFICLV